MEDLILQFQSLTLRHNNLLHELQATNDDMATLALLHRESVEWHSLKPEQYEILTEAIARIRQRSDLLQQMRPIAVRGCPF